MKGVDSKISVAEPSLDIVSSIRALTPSYKVIKKRLAQALRDVGTTPVPVCLLILGDSRVGKSCPAEDFIDEQSQAQSDVSTRSVLYVLMPAKVTILSLIEQILFALRDPLWERGSLGTKTKRLYGLIDRLKVVMIIFDEFQHLWRSAKPGGQRAGEVADWLKNLTVHRQLAIVGIGLPELRAHLIRHEQLSNRFGSPIVIPTFDWMDEQSRGLFKGVLLAFESELMSIEMPSTEDADVAFRFFLACAGRVGLLVKILDRAVKTCIENNSLKIRMADLQAAFESEIWFSAEFPVVGGPFLGKIEALRTEQNIEQTMGLSRGACSEDEEPKVRIAGRQPSSTSRGSDSSMRRAGRPKSQKRVVAEKLACAV